VTRSSNLIAAIMRGEHDDDLDALMDAVVARRKNARSRAAASLSVGDRVRLRGIRPKALEGATGTVKNIARTRIGVQIDKEFAWNAGRFSSAIELGAPLRVPVVCVVPA
jgi:hypothetical protein